jgi:hypothetical protein
MIEVLSQYTHYQLVIFFTILVVVSYSVLNTVYGQKGIFERELKNEKFGKLIDIFFFCVPFGFLTDAVDKYRDFQQTTISVSYLEAFCISIGVINFAFMILKAFLTKNSAGTEDILDSE